MSQDSSPFCLDQKSAQISPQESLHALWNAPVGFCKTTTEGHLIFANPAFAILLGYTCPEELLGSVRDVSSQVYVDPQDRESLKAQLRRRMEILNYECRLLRKDGSSIWVSINAQIVQDPSGRLSHIQSFITDITVRRRDRQALIEGEQRFRQMFLNAPLPYQSLDEQGKFLEMNQAFLDELGYSRQELLGKSFTLVLHPDWVEHFQELFPRLKSVGEILGAEFEMLRKDGSSLLVSLHGKTQLGEEGHFKCTHCIFQNITEQKQAEERLKASEEKYRALVEQSMEMVYMHDLQGNLLEVNQAAIENTGYSRQELLKMNMFDLFADQLEQESVLRQWRDWRPGQSETMDAVHQKKDGSSFQVEVTSGKIRFSGQERILALARDISERKRFEERLKYLSQHDQFTGLYNRAFFDTEIERLSRSRDFPISIISGDVDGLKFINDTMGHAKGDDLLLAAARVLRKSLRGSDVLARAGGDEFAVLMPGTDESKAHSIVKRILSNAEEHNREHPELPLFISLGIATAENRYFSLEATYRMADDRMYRQKRVRRETVNRKITYFLLNALGKIDYLTQDRAYRLSELCRSLAKKSGLSEASFSRLDLLAQVHDLGQVCMPVEVILKPGSLHHEEWDLVREHPEKGYRIAQSTAELAGIADLILKHHERWDGKGYPLGLKGEEIPIECRILAIADAYQVMTSGRPYRSPCSSQEALQELQRCAGSQFDPELVENFLQMMNPDRIHS